MLNVVKLIVCVESRAARAVAAIQGQAAAYDAALASLSAAVERARADVQAARAAAEARISAGSAAAALSLEALASAMADDVQAVDSLVQDQASGLEEFACQCGDDAPPAREDKPAAAPKPARKRRPGKSDRKAEGIAGVIAAETKTVYLTDDGPTVHVYGPGETHLYSTPNVGDDMSALQRALEGAGVTVYRSRIEWDAITDCTTNHQSS